MSSSDAQKSEVHDTTADASTAPVSPNPKTDPSIDSRNANIEGKAQKRDPDDVTPEGMTIISDETDNGGPLVIETDDSN